MLHPPAPAPIPNRRGHKLPFSGIFSLFHGAGPANFRRKRPGKGLYRGGPRPYMRTPLPQGDFQ